jgi:hypothetical protein
VDCARPDPVSTTASPVASRTSAASQTIWPRLAHQRFTGYDPYDAMSSGGAPAGLCSPVMSRRLVTQLVKRCQVSLEPVLGIPKVVSAYTVGHALTAVARNVRNGVPSPSPIACTVSVRIGASSLGGPWRQCVDYDKSKKGLLPL